MIKLTKVISTELNILGQRLVKVMRMGLDDIQTPKQATPYGLDSHPIKNMVGIYMPTGVMGETVLAGYLNKNCLAAIGEFRCFSTDADGALKTYVWCKNDGTLLLGGDAGNAVRYQELKSGFDQLKQDHNTLVNLFNTHVHSGVTSGLSSTAVTATLGTPSTADISGSKIDEIKTP